MLVYDPNVTLSRFTGMRPDMRQIGVPSPPLPPFSYISFPTNLSTAKYKSGSYNVFAETALPLSIASITYFNISQQQALQCSMTYRLDATVSFQLLDPAQSAYSNRVPVDSLQFFVSKLEAQIYVMTEPQIFTADFLLAKVPLTTTSNPFSKLPMPKTPDGKNYVYGNYTQSYNIANNSVAKFSITNKQIMELVQQTDRIALNVEFDLIVYDAKNADVNPALMINMDQLTIQFVLTPTNVVLE